MKDLYLELGIDQQASEADIAASTTSNAGLGDSAALLLDPQRRAVYDSTYTTLKTIGELRHRLGMDANDSWFIENHPDFVPSLKQARSKLRASDIASKAETPDAKEAVSDVPAAPAPNARKESGPGKSTRILGILVVVVIAAALLMLALR